MARVKVARCVHGSTLSPPGLQGHGPAASLLPGRCDRLAYRVKRGGGRRAEERREGPDSEGGREGERETRGCFAASSNPPCFISVYMIMGLAA